MSSADSLARGSGRTEAAVWAPLKNKQQLVKTPEKAAGEELAEKAKQEALKAGEGILNGAHLGRRWSETEAASPACALCAALWITRDIT